MPEKHVYEYAVIRLVPQVEREEFLNIGIILFSKNARFIDVLFHLDPEKITLFSKTTDLDFIEKNMNAFIQTAKGGRQGGMIGSEDLPSRFRWLTAARSSILQTSKVHSGYTDDLKKTMQRLFEEYVL